MTNNFSGLSAEHLTSFIEKIENLEQEKANIMNDIKDVYGEATASGFDGKIMRQIIRMRKMDTQELAEQQSLLDLYKEALGMVVC